MEVLGLALLALALGAVSVVQSVTNGITAGRIGLWTTMLVNATIVFGGALTLWIATRGWVTAAQAKLPPWYLLVGGVYGLTFLAGAAFVFPRLGAGPTTALVVTAQLITALVLDHVGLPSVKLPVTPVRVCGVVLLSVGALLVLWPKLRA